MGNKIFPTGQSVAAQWQWGCLLQGSLQQHLQLDQEGPLKPLFSSVFINEQATVLHDQLSTYICHCYSYTLTTLKTSLKYPIYRHKTVPYGHFWMNGFYCLFTNVLSTYNPITSAAGTLWDIPSRMLINTFRHTN